MLNIIINLEKKKVLELLQYKMRLNVIFIPQVMYVSQNEASLLMFLFTLAEDIEITSGHRN